MAALCYLVVAVIGLATGRSVIWLVSRTGERFLQALRERVFRHLMGLSMDFYEREKTGRLVSRMTSDIDALQELISQGLVMFIQNILIFIGAIVVIFVMSWQLALCTLVIVPPLLIASRWFRRESNRAYLEVRESIGQNLATLQEGLEGVRVVQAFGRERGWIRRFHNTNEAQYEANLETVRISAKYFPIVEFSGVLGIAIVVGVGGLFVDQGIITVGTVLAFVLYLNSLFEPIQQLSQLYNTVQSAGAALHKVFALLDTEGTVGEKPGAVDLPDRGAIEVDGVAFAYGGGPPDTAGEIHPLGPMVLRDVSLTVAPGERVALVGPTGAGKSTLAKLMVRFYDPAEGAVRFDGVDLRDATMASLRQRIVVVPAGRLPLRRNRARQHPGRPSRGHRRRGRRGSRSTRAVGHLRRIPRRSRYRGARARLATLGRGEAARVAGACRVGGPCAARARRSDVQPRPRHRAPRRARARDVDRGPDRRGGRAPPLDRGALRSDRGGRRRSADGGRHPRRAARTPRPLLPPLRRLGRRPTHGPLRLNPRPQISFWRQQGTSTGPY